MKVLLDTCVWGGARDALAALGHDVFWTGEWAEDPGDEQILDYARREGRVLVTLDKDFGELVFLRRLPHRGVIRLVGFRAEQQGVVCGELLDRYQVELEAGAMVTAEPGRVRIRNTSL